MPLCSKKSSVMIIRISSLVFFFCLNHACYCQTMESEFDYTKLIENDIDSIDSQRYCFLGEMNKVFEFNNSINIDTSLFSYVKGKKLVTVNDAVFFDDIKNAHLTIINEAHDRIKPRSFICEYLSIFKAYGYTHLAMETLYDNPALLNVNTGYYTKEPIFGELYREALKLGFKIISYESQSINRDSMQAVNIAKQIVNSDKVISKTLIICGYGHLYENYFDHESKMMAAYLKELIKTDPLTIDLTTFQEAESNAYKKSIYEALYDSLPVIYSKGEIAKLEVFPELTDYVILLPKTTFINGRSIDFSLKNKKERYAYICKNKNCILVQVYLLSELKKQKNSNKLVPTDQVLTRTSSTLYLKKHTTYIIIERGKDNQILNKKRKKIHL